MVKNYQLTLLCYTIGYLVKVNKKVVKPYNVAVVWPQFVTQVLTEGCDL